ncbi:MAG: hypothetical protein GKC03_08310 [Methanomassiliicoccales archaeon]|nr:hypothetical protein [Methanomassiliicoccales archaeon]NYT15635.1 hypothetical protein [Methanomassiliicoccales archaeon]
MNTQGPLRFISLDGLEITHDDAVNLLDHAVIYVSVTNTASQARAAWLIAEFSLNGSLGLSYSQREIVLEPGQTKFYSFTFNIPLNNDLEPMVGFEFVTYLSATEI